VYTLLIYSIVKPCRQQQLQWASNQEGHQVAFQLQFNCSEPVTTETQTRSLQAIYIREVQTSTDIRPDSSKPYTAAWHHMQLVNQHRQVIDAGSSSCSNDMHHVFATVSKTSMQGSFITQKVLVQVSSDYNKCNSCCLCAEVPRACKWMHAKSACLCHKMTIFFTHPLMRVEPLLVHAVQY
jgi:hypothetical protein